MGTERESRWQPYEDAFAENLLAPWLPRRFYAWRWAIMIRNPLCWRVPRRSFTWGEVIVSAVIVGQALWMSLIVALDDGDWQSRVRSTGAPTGCRKNPLCVASFEKIDFCLQPPFACPNAGPSNVDVNHVHIGSSMHMPRAGHAQCFAFTSVTVLIMSACHDLSP